jgi:putative ABC transport system permease protein
MNTILKDLRHALRGFRRNPGFALVALLTVALGVGATTAVFSLIDGVLLEPLPYAQPERVAIVYAANPAIALPRFPVSGADYLDWRKQTKTFAPLAARRAQSYNLTGGDRPLRVSAERGTADLFTALGLTPLLGRAFVPADDSPGGAKVAVLAASFFKRHFGGDRKALGRQLVLNGESYTVVGVVPDDHRGSIDLWTPLGLDPTRAQRDLHTLEVIGRLAPGASLGQAKSEMSTIAARQAAAYPELDQGWGAAVVPMREAIVEDVRPALLLLFAAVGLVLLIACANLANLLLARVSGREGELAVRKALGAGRGRLLSQLLTESLTLSVLGGVLGLFLAAWGTRALLAMNPKAVPRAGEVGVDWRVLAFALAVAVVTGLAFGLVPAFRAAGADLTPVLKEGGRAQAGGSRRARGRTLLVFAEMALALILLAGAGLLIGSFARLAGVDPGFRPERVLTVQLALPRPKYKDPARQAAFAEELLAREGALPGVAAAGIVSALPLSDRTPQILFTVEKRPVASPAQAPHCNYRSVSPGYFAAMGIPLRRGRVFTAADRQGAPKVILLNESMAKQLFPGEDALGKRLTIGVPVPPEEPEWVTVVGIVGDVRHTSLKDESGMEMFWPYAQEPFPDFTLVLAAAGAAGNIAPGSLATPARQAVQSIDPDLPVFHVRPMAEVVSEALAPARLSTVLFGLFAALALALAAVGLYGVMSYSVAERRREIGIRMALGADRARVFKLVLSQAMGVALLGVVVGLLGSLAATRVLRSLLYGVGAVDALTFPTVAALLTGVAFLASYLPARRATAVDPQTALRGE